MNPIQATAYKCLYLASTELVQRMFKGNINKEIVQEVLESIPELETILPAEPTQKGEVSEAVFRVIQEKKKRLDGLPAFIEQWTPQHDDPELQGHQTFEFMEEVRQQFEESLLPTFEVLINGGGDIATYKAYLAKVSGNPSINKNLPFERFLTRMISIVGRKEGREEKLKFLNRFRQLLAEDFPTNKDKLVSHLKEVIWMINNFVSKVFTTLDKVELIKVIEEEIDSNPAFKALYERLDGDLDKLTDIVSLAHAASGFLNEELGQNTTPGNFYPKE